MGHHLNLSTHRMCRKRYFQSHNFGKKTTSFHRRRYVQHSVDLKYSSIGQEYFRLIFTTSDFYKKNSNCLLSLKSSVSYLLEDVNSLGCHTISWCFFTTFISFHVHSFHFIVHQIKLDNLLYCSFPCWNRQLRREPRAPLYI